MLVLSRQSGESIVVGDGITVSILAIEGRRVKVGVSAPPEVTIVREELLVPKVIENEPTPDSHASFAFN